jgi:hypothetical protein
MLEIFIFCIPLLTYSIYLISYTRSERIQNPIQISWKEKNTIPLTHKHISADFHDLRDIKVHPMAIKKKVKLASNDLQITTQKTKF